MLWSLALLLVIPLTTGSGWEVLRDRGIAPHVIAFGADGLRVEVNASAAPIVYPLDAPRWVWGLQAEGRMGVAGIRFFNVALSPSQVGQSRQHPASALISERVVTAPDAAGRFTVAVDLDAPIETAAVWISVDGDDTGSRFTLTLARLELRLADRPTDGRPR